MDFQEIVWMRQMVSLFPNALFVHKFVTVLTLNHQSEEAKFWIARMKKIVSDSDYLTAKEMWKKQGERNKIFKEVDWPA
ncbi:hypothetical protein GCM10008066_14800 [Oxalicibacterium faecigallinarum]|uniref:Uncharacterized protein n=2 Tax=Oxalicibacterium faecigallinarum TaxID=573741 RepID=A0A8J3AR16_9BURK|nr:hypothetical protein GCM10008066_14800 [Oxalicibacterium faecigallinarum]